MCERCRLFFSKTEMIYIFRNTNLQMLVQPNTKIKQSITPLLSAKYHYHVAYCSLDLSKPLTALFSISAVSALFAG